MIRDSWQHAIDNHLVGYGKTSEELNNPHEAVQWLLEQEYELAVFNDTVGYWKLAGRVEELEKVLEECSGNINPERGFADELEAEITKVLHTTKE